MSHKEQAPKHKKRRFTLREAVLGGMTLVAAGTSAKLYMERGRDQSLDPVRIVTQSPLVDSATPTDIQTTQAEELSKDFILRTALDYCKVADCLMDPYELAGRIIVSSNPNEFSEDIDFVAKTVTLNKSFVDSRIKNAPAQTRNVVSNFEVRAREALLYHSFSHLNTHQEFYTFTPFSIALPGETDFYNVRVIEDFVFTGINSKTGEERHFPGLSESIAELVSVSVQLKKDGVVIPFSDLDSQGAHLLRDVLSRTNITPEEFLSYASGRMPFQSLISEMASNLNSEHDAIRALAISGFTSLGYFSYEEGLNVINSIIPPLTPTPEKTPGSIT